MLWKSLIHDYFAINKTSKTDKTSAVELTPLPTKAAAIDLTNITPTELENEFKKILQSGAGLKTINQAITNLVKAIIKQQQFPCLVQLIEQCQQDTNSKGLQILQIILKRKSLKAFWQQVLAGRPSAFQFAVPLQKHQVDAQLGKQKVFKERHPFDMLMGQYYFITSFNDGQFLHYLSLALNQAQSKDYAGALESLNKSLKYKSNTAIREIVKEFSILATSQIDDNMLEDKITHATTKLKQVFKREHAHYYGTLMKGIALGDFSCYERA